MTHYVTPHGECIQMADYKKPTSTYRFQMLETALQRPTSWSQAMDGAKISNKESHTYNGAKLLDICARDPVTREFKHRDSTSKAKWTKAMSSTKLGNTKINSFVWTNLIIFLVHSLLSFNLQRDEDI
jgi:hypothetical protein